MKKKSGIHFLGFLSNVDSSILKFPFEHGLKIECMDSNDAAELMGNLENIESFNAFHKLNNLRCINNEEKKAYCLTFIIDANPTDSFQFGMSKKVSDFNNNIETDYIYNLLKKMRLFKEGNILLAYHYYYSNNVKGEFKSGMHGGTTLHIIEDRFTLEKSEINDLIKFVKKTKFPISQSHIQLAFENFELSHHVTHQRLEFLLLMISLESLFNPSNGELRHRISRSLAVLLGRDKSEASSIFKESKLFYDKRSELVHNGKVNISNQEIKKLRFFVRESIKLLISINKKKEAILSKLDESGFGEKPFS